VYLSIYALSYRIQSLVDQFCERPVSLISKAGSTLRALSPHVCQTPATTMMR
jgi:hypothetical protein